MKLYQIILWICFVDNFKTFSVTLLYQKTIANDRIVLRFRIMLRVFFRRRSTIQKRSIILSKIKIKKSKKNEAKKNEANWNWQIRTDEKVFLRLLYSWFIITVSLYVQLHRDSSLSTPGHR